MKFSVILYIIFSLGSLLAETPTLEQLLKSAESVKDPVKRKKLEDKIRDMHEKSKGFISPDYASETTEQLIERVLRGVPINPRQLDLINNVLRKREDFKGLIRKGIEGFDMALFDHPNPSAIRISEPYTYAGLSSVGGKEFQIEIIKKSIDHPIVKKLGVESLRPFLRMLAQISDENAALILDRLIAQKRIEKGSKFEKEWRKKLSEPNRQTTRPKEPRQPRGNKNSDVDREIDFPVATADFFKSKWAVIVVIIFVLGGLGIWVKARVGP